jgi:uncharacterized protein (TIGR03435 family)
MRQGRLGVLASAALFAQAPVVRPEFEVASIKPAAPDEFNRAGAGMHLDGSQVSYKYLSLHNYIAAAYRLKGYEILGPDWLASQRFDITAKLPAGASVKQIPEMLQALLEDRFQMKIHREKKEVPVYGLVLGKGGLKMQSSPPDLGKESQAGGATVDVAATRQAGGVKVGLGNGAYYVFGDNKLEGRKMSVSRMADTLAAFVGRPVVDMTELKGNYDFVIELSPEDFLAMGVRRHGCRCHGFAPSDPDG